MVSAIITTYNREKLLEKCLKSIVNQTYKDIEIIVIDDGSTDNTSEIVKRFNDDRISYYNFGRTKNVSHLRNEGIKISKGEYIAFCDDDDLWMENKIETQIKYFTKEKIVCSNGNVIDDNDLVILKEINNYNKDMYFDLAFMLKDNRMLTSSILVSKDVFLNVGLFDESHKSRGEDYDMWIRFADSKYKVKYLTEPLVSYRVHTGNLSRKSFSDAQEVYEKNIELLAPYSKNSNHEIAESANFGIRYAYRRLIRVSIAKAHFFDCFLYILKYLRKFAAI